MALDEQLLNRKNSDNQPGEADGFSSSDQEDNPSSRAGNLRAAKQAGPQADGNTRADDLKRAKQWAKIGLKAAVGNETGAIKDALTQVLLKKKMRKDLIRGLVMSVLPGACCCLIMVFGWVIIISLLLRVMENPFSVADLAFGWVWGKVGNFWSVIVGS